MTRSRAPTPTRRHAHAHTRLGVDSQRCRSVRVSKGAGICRLWARRKKEGSTSRSGWRREGKPGSCKGLARSRRCQTSSTKADTSTHSPRLFYRFSHSVGERGGGGGVAREVDSAVVASLCAATPPSSTSRLVVVAEFRDVMSRRGGLAFAVFPCTGARSGTIDTTTRPPTHPPRLGPPRLATSPNFDTLAERDAERQRGGRGGGARR